MVKQRRCIWLWHVVLFLFSTAAAAGWPNLVHASPAQLQSQQKQNWQIVRSELSNSAACESWRDELVGDPLSESALKSEQIVVANLRGEILYSWANGKYLPQTPHVLWSVSKSITAALLGTSIYQGRLALESRVADFLPALPQADPKDRERWGELRFSHLIAMTSGISWAESVRLDVREISVLPFLYGADSKDFAKGVRKLPFAEDPGVKWNYSSANANILMAALKPVFTETAEAYDNFPWTNLFDPLRLKSAHLEQDEAGTALGAQYIYLSAEDMARFGVFILNDGVTAEGERLLPEGWLQFSQELEPTSAAQIKTRDDFKTMSTYGRGGFWLNQDVADLGRPFPDGPTDLLFADGFMGQWILIFPSVGLVLARTGHDLDPYPHVNAVIAKTLACFTNSDSRGVH